MDKKTNPHIFNLLEAEGCIKESDILNTDDGLFLVYKSLSDILEKKGIYDFPDSTGERLACKSFFDDWFLYAVRDGNEFTYSLVKLREQEHDTEDGKPSDGDVPGVTISFISFECEVLMDCLTDSSDENRQKLNNEINRVVAYRGQKHHRDLKKYFVNSEAEGPYLIAGLYVKHIASLAEDGVLAVPGCYSEIYQQSVSYKNSAKFARLPKFIESINREAGYTVCDHEKIYIKDKMNPDEYEKVVILATHTGNTSVYSFAAEVEYHARFLVAPAKAKIPFFGGSIYDSAIRADMTIDDKEFEGPAPFYKEDSKIVRRQKSIHR